MVPNPTPAQRRAIDRHLDELDLWNRRLNLTAVARDGAWERHVVESLALLDAAGLREGARCVDLGSGGGIPGMIVAVVRPDLAVTLIESDRRKAGFLVHVSGLLELGNVSVAARRAEEMGADPAHRGRYDAVLSRAAAPPPLLCALSMPLLRRGGTLWALVASGDGEAALATLAGDAAVRAERPARGILAVHKLGDAGSAG
ncbi:MAG: 16S rRNA (guanine(527)-N(7))-methyltransferase RsmG [Candidatus Dormibacteraeota bacterium]|nr:16S rRNA (guanine(527)-N(7))-methyltransferase RsmG [Candidatus Dormibacteraeota bacterium]